MHINLIMEFSAENLERAVCQFYQSDTVSQAQAHHFLTAAKTSPQAWAFVWELLQPTNTTEVQFYGATTLHTKVEKNLNELSDDEINALRDRIFSAIITYTNGPKIVLNRLCISLCAYMLHTCPEKWKDVLTQLYSTFTPESLPHIAPDRILWVLLEILSLLPEEFSCMQSTSHKKGLVRHELDEHLSQILGFTEGILTSSTDPEVTVQAVKCIASWCCLSVSLSHCQNITSILVGLVFNYHKINSGICDKSLDALCAIAVSPDGHKYPTHLFDFLNKVLQLREIIARELLCPDTTDQNLVRNIYSLLIGFGESHSKHCLDWLKSEDTREQVMALVTSLLHCSGTHGSYPVDETYSRLSFCFWYILQDQIFASEVVDFDLIMSLLGPIYKDLVNVLITKAQLPSDNQDMSCEDAELFRCYRQDIGDTMMYCYSILKKTTLNLIKIRLEKINADKEPSWQELEACLFSLCSIAENVELEESEYLPALFQYIRQLPFQAIDPRVLSTALDTVGSYAEWISANDSIFEHILPLITLGLNVPDAAPSATMALKDLAHDCQTAMLPYHSIILDTSQEILRSGRLKLSEGTRLMYSVGRVLSILPLETIFRYLDLIVTPYITQLNHLSMQEPSHEVKVNILTCLKLMGMLTAALDIRQDPVDAVASSPVELGPQPVLIILQKLLPVIKVIVNSWGTDSTIMQAIYALLKHSIVTLLDDSRPIVGEVITLITSSYRVCSEPSAMDLAKQLCILFGKEEESAPIMQNLMRELCSVTLNRVSSSSNLSDNTEILDGFFLLLSQVVKKVPQLLVFNSVDDCIPLIQCAILTLGIPELPTVKAATSFLVNFITQSRELPILLSVVNACGEQIIEKIVILIGGEAPRGNIDPLSDILLAMNKKYCDNTARWLNKAVNEAVCPHTNQIQRDTFVKSVLRERTNKRKLQDQVLEFSLICRGLITAGIQPISLFRHN